MKKYIKSLLVSLMVILMALSPCAIMSANADSTMMGDVDGNGRITSVDALSIQRYIAKLDKLSESQLAVADLNDDGKVTLIDALRILRYIAGYSDSLTNDDGQNYAEEVVRLVNIERAKEGLSPLTLDEKLTEAANLRAKEAETLFSHTRPNGQDWSTVLSEFNITYSTAGENIAAGQSTPAEVVTAWMNSESHRRNIMSSSFTKIGVGYYFDKDSDYGYYWEQLFAG